MQNKWLSCSAKVAGAILVVGLLAAGAVAQDGFNPYGGLVSDAAGNLYGMTSEGGASGSFGTVFELVVSEEWGEDLLLSFNGVDGYAPYSGLIFDSSGDLYGTTSDGGTHGEGTAFELIPKGGGVWTRKVLHNFNANEKDGTYPNAGLIIDGNGNLYGTTGVGGVYNDGVAFELTPIEGGGWSEKILHTFRPNGIDGTRPNASLILDSTGNLYGTTPGGGAYNDGTVFELTPNADGEWTEKVLHNFNPNRSDGLYPKASLIFDASGNLYGTTLTGTHGDGTVFELTPKGGSWTETILHNFASNGEDGGQPYASLIFDAEGNLYGTTAEGGINNGGTVFELTPKSDGSWAETVLHKFNQKEKDGIDPYSNLTFDAAGDLYGTTEAGGTYNVGTVFELTPEANGTWTETIIHEFSNQ
jgi:uncharacterized repeat protein (TIGR03803 family)